MSEDNKDIITTQQTAASVPQEQTAPETGKKGDKAPKGEKLQAADDKDKKRKHRSLGLRILSFINDMTMTVASVCAVTLLFLCAVSVYVSPAYFKYASVLGLIFPGAVALTVLVFIICLVFCFRRSWICFVGLCLTFGSIRSYFPINPFQAAHLPSSEALRVMTYNTHGTGNVKDSTLQTDYLQYVLDQQADIFVFQEGSPEFLEWDSINPRFRQRYPYCEIPFPGQSTHQGCCSRYPIKRSEVVTHVGSGNAAIAFWIEHPTQHEILVINCHLRSNQLTEGEREQYSAIVHNSNQTAKETEQTHNTVRMLADKFIKAAELRAHMADTIADFLNKHRDVPTIVCGDFNDTPISYSCSRVKRCGLNDAFRMTGNGMGRSFNKDAIAVRIDHAFCSDHFQPISARIDKLPDWSDHYPLIVTFEWAKK